MFELDIRFGQENAAVVIEIVARIDDALNARVDEHFGAGQAGLMGDIGGCAFGADAMERGLDDGILFGVKCAHAMPIDNEVAYFVAMGQTRGRAVVACGKDAFVAHKHRTDMGAITGAAFGYAKGYVQEVFIQVGRWRRIVESAVKFADIDW